MADRARFEHGGDNDDFAERAQRVRQSDNALGPIAIVIGNQDAAHEADQL
jgi:hypothetical protein